jgi:hypothetical protein
MSPAIRYAPSPTPPATGAPLGGSRAALAPVAPRPRRRAPLRDPVELALTATLYPLYLGVRGSARVVGALESLVRR